MRSGVSCLLGIPLEGEVVGDAPPNQPCGWVALAYPMATPEGSGRKVSPVASGSARLLQHLQSFAQGSFGHRLAVVGISSQSSLVQAALSKRLGLTIPLVSDPFGRVARALSIRSISLGRRRRLMPTLLVYLGREEVARFEGFDAIGLNMQPAVREMLTVEGTPSGRAVPVDDDAAGDGPLGCFREPSQAGRERAR